MVARPAGGLFPGPLNQTDGAPGGPSFCSAVSPVRQGELKQLQYPSKDSTVTRVFFLCICQSPQRVQALRHEFESDLRAQHYANALQLLVSDTPLTSGSVVTSHPTLTENSVTVQTAAQEAQAEDGTDKADVCSGSVHADNEIIIHSQIQLQDFVLPQGAGRS